MADELHIRCPACGTWRTTPDYTVGLSVACGGCGKSITVSPGGDGKPPVSAPENDFAPSSSDAVPSAVHDAFADDSVDELETVSAQETVGSNRCVQCQREFRGDWDQVESDAGTICYICSNLATEGIPDRVLDKPDPQELKFERIAPVGRGDVDERNVLFDPKSEQFQKILLGVALVTVFVTFIVLITGYGDSSGGGGGSEIRTEVPDDIEMPDWLMVAFRITMTSQTYLALGLAIFITFWRRNGLPQDTTRANIVYIAGVVGICLLLRVVHAVLWVLWMQHDTIGDLYSKFFFIVIYAGSFILVYRAFDWWFRDLIVFAFVWGVSNSIVYAITTFIFGGLATVFV